MTAPHLDLAVGIEELLNLRGRPGGPGHRAGDHPGNQNVLAQYLYVLSMTFFLFLVKSKSNIRIFFNLNVDRYFSSEAPL